MQLVDGKLYIANAPVFGSDRQRFALGDADSRFGSASSRTGRADLVSRLKRSSASERLLALMLAAFVAAASPALLETVRSTVSLSLQILLQVGHAGFVAFQIFGR
jgi:hypothetical protein